MRLSKRLAFVLRHRPDSIGLTLDEAGWVSVGELLAALSRSGPSVQLSQLEAVVAQNDKRRYAFNDDHTRIRAVQGHSVKVELGLRPYDPPAELFHGTVERALPSIMRLGLTPQGRHHVHLSKDPETARKVGQRRGKPVVLTIAALELAATGHAFFESDNGVVLTDAVPPAFLRRDSDLAG